MSTKQTFRQAKTYVASRTFMQTDPEGTNGQFAVDGGDDDRVPARRARAVHDKGIAGKDPRLGHAVALDGDEERCRGPLDEMLI